MRASGPKITVCLPHWEVERYAKICLRSIRAHSRKYDLEVIVVDNGSRDASLDYLRSLDWIRLVERPEETRANWPANFFTALDCGLRLATGEFFLTLHTDVFVKRDDWLDPFLRELSRGGKVAMAGAWKLELASSWYLWQKRVFGYLTYRAKRILGGRKRPIRWKEGDFPRDYCAMYRRQALLDVRATFGSVNGWVGGGCSVGNQLFAHGYEAAMFPVAEMGEKIVHVTHGTAAVRTDHPLRHQAAQRKAEARIARLFREAWVRELETNAALDGPAARAA